MKTVNKSKLQLSILSCALTMTLAGCATKEPLVYEGSSLAGISSGKQKSNLLPTNGKGDVKVNNKAEYLAPLKSVNEITPREQLKQQQYQFAQAESVKLAVENMPLRDFIHYIFGDLLAVNYVMDEAAIDNQQTVSLKIEQAITAGELFEIVADLLQEKKLSVQLKQKVFYVFKAGSKSNEEGALLGFGNKLRDVPVGSEEVMQLVPLKYTSYKRIRRVMTNLIKAEVYSEIDYAGLSIKGKRSEVVKALNLLQLLDQPSAKSQFIGIYPLVFLTPEEFVTGMNKLLTEDGFDVQNGVKFTAIEHLNSVIVHASDQHLLDRIEMWQTHLDKASETADKQYFVFYPDRANAVTLGESLNRILALQKGGSVPAPSTNKVAANSNRTANGNGTKSKKQQTSRTNFEGIAVDEQRNALVFYMQPKEYQAIYPLLNQLDVLPKQVIVEATIMEVTLTDRLNYGVEWFIKNEVDSFGTKDGLGELGGGLTFTLNKPNLDVVMNALASTNQVNIVSNPKLMVTNGETANLSVGTEFPVISSSVQNATEGSGQVLQSIQYRSTGINLSVTPNVNAQNYVELEIQQKLSEAGENELSGIDSPIVLNREFDTKVLVEEGQTLILAGLISENVSATDTKVPILGDIPILGEAFKNNTDRTTRTELILMITPKVVSNSADFDLIKRAIGSKFEQIDLKENFYLKN